MPLRTKLGMSPPSTIELAISTLASVESLPVTGWALTTRTRPGTSAWCRPYLKVTSRGRARTGFAWDAGHDDSVDLLPAGSRTAVSAAT